MAPFRPPLPPLPPGLHSASSSPDAEKRLVGDGKTPFGQVIVHTGDFRFDERMRCVFSKDGPRSPLLPDLSHLPIDCCYLDTTYCYPQHNFPPQSQSIQYAVDTVQRVLAAEKRSIAAEDTEATTSQTATETATAMESTTDRDSDGDAASGEVDELAAFFALSQRASSSEQNQETKLAAPASLFDGLEDDALLAETAADRSEKMGAECSDDETDDLLEGLNDMLADCSPARARAPKPLTSIAAAPTPARSLSDVLNGYRVQKAGSTLFVVGAYVVGKERILLQLAAQCGLMIYAAPARLKTLRSLDLFAPSPFPFAGADSAARGRLLTFSEVFTGDMDKARVHVLPMSAISLQVLVVCCPCQHCHCRG